MSGLIRDCWEDDTLIIAKGMGNFETISEYDAGRPVIYVMKVKCRSMAEAVLRNVGQYTAFIGGEHGEERLL